MAKFDHDVVGGKFKVKANDVKFEVTVVAPFPEDTIAPSWKRGVMAAEEGDFVCAHFGKYLIPVIRCKGGVVQLKEVIVGGKKLTKSHEIATALGATEAYKAYKLKRKD